MPNHTSTILEIRGKDDRVQECVKFVSSVDKKGKSCPFDCDKVVPMPKELLGISSPVQIVSPEEYEKAVLASVKSGPVELPLTKELQEKYLKDYGADNWYDFALKRWGSKWGAYDHDKWNITQEGKATVATLFFMSAWSPVIPTINALAKKYQDLDFSLKYADEGGSFLGITHWPKGCKAKQTNYNWKSEAGILLLAELGIHNEDEEDVPKKVKKVKKVKKCKERGIAYNCDSKAATNVLKFCKLCYLKKLGKIKEAKND